MARAIPTPFSAELDRRWREQLNQGRLFLNEQFLTIVIRPPRGKAGLPERLSKLGSQARPTRSTGAEALELDSATAALERRACSPMACACSAPTRPRPASIRSRSSFCRRSTMARCGRCCCRGPSRTSASTSLIARQLRARRAGGARARAAAASRASLGIKEYPDASRAGLLDALLRLPHELVITESFAPIERQTARERIDLALRRLKSADEGAATERAEMLAARDAVGAGQLSFGDHHLSLLVRSGSLETLESATADAAAALADIGAVAVREDVNLEPAFWGQFPGNEQYVVRRALISSSNAAGLHLAARLPAGPRARQPLGRGGDACFETTSATPYFFNFHEGDLGNFTIIGPSGSGKTVVLNFLAAQAQKFAPRTILFDKDRGAEIFLRALGGRYERITRGAPTGFNPLRCPTTPVNRAFLRDWLGVPARGQRRRGRDGDRQGGRREFRPRARASPPALPARPARRRPPAAAGRPAVAARPVDLRRRARLAVRQPRRRARLRQPRARLRHDRAARGPPAAHPGAAVPVPPHRGAARRLADDDPDRRGLEGARRSDVRRAHPQLDEDAAQAQRDGRLRHPVGARTRSTARSPRRSSSRPRRRSSCPTPRRARSIIAKASASARRSSSSSAACRRTAAASSSARPTARSSSGSTSTACPTC